MLLICYNCKWKLDSQLKLFILIEADCKGFKHNIKIVPNIRLSEENVPQATGSMLNPSEWNFSKLKLWYLIVKNNSLFLYITYKYYIGVIKRLSQHVKPMEIQPFRFNSDKDKEAIIAAIKRMEITAIIENKYVGVVLAKINTQKNN